MEHPSSFADRYQTVLVPVIFEPWARELIGRANPRSGDDILDLACGTGVVTRQVAEFVPEPGCLTGVDHSAEMLSVARTLAEGRGLKADWIEADAASLPFEDDRFDIAFCQQALQFFPDKPAALRELRRVMKPNGRVALCVQRELDVNPLLKAQAAALEAHIGKDAGAAVRAICSLPNANDLRRLFEEAGFETVEIEPVTLTLHHPDARIFAAGAMGGMHTGDKLSGIDAAKVERAIETFVAELGAYLDGSQMRVPHDSHVILAGC